MSGNSIVQNLQANRGWLLVLGIAYVILGWVAIGYPMAATIAIEMLLGYLLLVGGVIAVVGSFFSGNWKNMILILLSGILYIFVGFFLVTNMKEGIITLTLLLAAFLLVEGIFKIIHSFQLKGAQNWVWILISGLASVILAVMIWVEFPQSSAFVIGLLVGIYFLINGFSLIMFSFALKDAK
ncbi:MAG: hypothetical protein DHS20C13_15730 [Thermodesulfobacteriota bacterium]|nr:MAG: hypothetical protein DHS20C13_15730 [Thermodesulfobacteriota bacterium]